MRTAAILESGGGIEALLRPLAQARQFKLLRPDDCATPLRCALLVAAPTLDRPAPEAVCRILLTPSDRSALLGAVRASWIVSCGASPRESISFSSVQDTGLTLVIRRRTPTLAGGFLETQELPMRCAHGAPEEMLLACAAALLMGGA